MSDNNNQLEIYITYKNKQYGVQFNWIDAILGIGLLVPFLSFYYINTSLAMLYSVSIASNLIIISFRLYKENNKFFNLKLLIIYIYNIISLYIILNCTTKKDQFDLINSCNEKYLNDTLIDCNTITKKCYEQYNLFKQNNITLNVDKFVC